MDRKGHAPNDAHRLAAKKMEMDRRNEIMKHFPALLSRWKGKSARLWNLSSSHPTLCIVLYGNDRTGSLEVACIDPERIEAPLRWENSDIQIGKAQNGMFKVIDQKAGVLISDCVVETKEFDKKPYQRQ